MSRILANGLHSADERMQELLRRCLQSNAHRFFREVFRRSPQAPSRRAFEVFLESIRTGVWDDQRPVPFLVYGSDVAAAWQVEAIGCFLERARERNADQLIQFELLSYNEVREIHKQRCEVPTHAKRIEELFEASPEAVASHVAEPVLQIIRDFADDDGECRVWSVLYASQRYVSNEDVLLLATVDALASLAARDALELESLLDKIESMPGQLGEWIKLRVFENGSRDLRSKGLKFLKQKVEGREDLRLVDDLATVASFLASVAADEELDEWEEFESVLLQHTTKWELGWSAGDRGGQSIVGRQAFQLLSQIGPARLSKSGEKRLKELKRVFGDIPPPLTSMGEGGVVSRVDTKIDGIAMSDRGWLSYLKNAKPESLSFLQEPDVFSTLREYVKQDPRRFSLLLLNDFDDAIPTDRYVAVAEGLGQLLQSARSSDEDNARPAEDLECELLFEVARTILDRDAERTVRSVRFLLYNVWKVKGRQPPSDLFNELLRQSVAHPDPAEDRKGSDPIQAGINSVRGSIAIFAAELIGGDERLFRASRNTIERLVEDDTVQVRACAAEAVLLSLNHDRQFALQQFLRLVEEAPEELLSVRGVTRFVRYGLCSNDFRSEVLPTLKRLLQVDQKSTLESAGELLVVGAYHSKELHLLNQEMERADMHVLRGATRALAGSFTQLPDELRQILLLLADDLNDDVAGVASYCFTDLAFDEDVENLEGFINDFAKTRAFAVQPEPLIRFLDAARSQMTTAALAVCEQFLGYDLEGARDLSTHRSGDAHSVSELLLRVYVDNSGDDAIQQRVLDLIDEMVRHDIWAVHSTLRKFSDDSQ